MAMSGFVDDALSRPDAAIPSDAHANAQSFAAGDIRRHLLGLAEISFTGCLEISGPVSGTICLHEGAIWHAQRTEQIHILSWLRTIGVIGLQDQANWESESPCAILREAAAKDPNLDLSIIEERAFDYVSTEVAALLDATAGNVGLIPGDTTDDRFVATWSVRHLLHALSEHDNDQPVAGLGPTDLASRNSAQASLRELGVIVES